MPMQQQPLLPNEEGPERELRDTRFMSLWPRSLKERARTYARRRGTSLNDIMLQAVEKLLDEAEGRAA